MDASAICAALASYPGPDCLKDVVKKCGPRLKVHMTLKAFCQDLEVSSNILTPFSSHTN